MFQMPFSKRKRKKIVQDITENYGKPVQKNRDIILIGAYYNTNTDKASIDTKTWEDLEMDKVFNFIDRTFSRTGEQFLYNQIHTKQSEEGFNRFNSKVKFYFNNFEDLISNSIVLEKYNKVCSYNLPHLLCETQLPHIPKWTMGLGILSLSLGLLCIFFSFLVIPFLIIGAINTFLHYYFKKNISYYFDEFQNIKSFRNYYVKLLANDNEDDFLSNKEIDILNRITKKLRLLSYNIEIADELSSILFYMIEIIKGIFLADAIQYNSVIKLINNNSATLLKIYCYIGMVDSAISIASVKKGSLGCGPTFVKGNTINILNAYHPLIDNCVKNSITLNNQHAIITGGNMSGKTSFLKTIGINIHLGQTINYSFCEKIEIPNLRIHSSIINEDDLEKGTSFFMDELYRTKDIIEIINSSRDKHLILIDEIYKGTNSKDRISLASSVLNYINKENCIVFVTTHDLDIINFVHNNYLTFYFEDSFEKNSVVFDYKIRNGIQNKTNVVELIKALNFPSDIVTNATFFRKKLMHKN